MRNEKTSKKVAKTSSHLLGNYKMALDDIEKIRILLLYVEEFVKGAASVAGSALTQAPNKKKR